MGSEVPESSAVQQVQQGATVAAVAAAVVGGATGCLYKDTCSTATAHPRGARALEQFAVTLQALPAPGGPPAIIRLRRFLKAALRSYGLRCVECREHAPPEAAGRIGTPPAATERKRWTSNLDDWPS
jgi:hypothetical protein